MVLTCLFHIVRSLALFPIACALSALSSSYSVLAVDMHGVSLIDTLGERLDERLAGNYILHFPHRVAVSEVTETGPVVAVRVAKERVDSGNTRHKSSNSIPAELPVSAQPFEMYEPAPPLTREESSDNAAGTSEEDDAERGDTEIAVDAEETQQQHTSKRENEHSVLETECSAFDALYHYLYYYVTRGTRLGLLDMISIEAGGDDEWCAKAFGQMQVELQRITRTPSLKKA